MYEDVHVCGYVFICVYRDVCLYEGVFKYVCVHLAMLCSFQLDRKKVPI